MPVHKVKGGYRWGKHGHVYPNKEGAEKQAQAIYASGYKGKSWIEINTELDSLIKSVGGVHMAKKVPKPTILRVKKSLDEVITHLEKAIDASSGLPIKPKKFMPKPLPEENENYEYGNGGEIQLKPENRIDAAERHPAFDPVMRDPSEGRVNKSFALLKCNTELKLKKAIALTEGYAPMSYVDLVKAFGTTENIPDIMKEEIYRPPTSWFENAIIKSSEIIEEPFEYAVQLWYGKELDLSKLHPIATMAASEAIQDPTKISQAAQGISDTRRALNPAGAIAEDKVRDDLNISNQVDEANMIQSEDDNIEKVLGGALVGGGIGSLLGHPIAGAAIGAGAEEVGKKFVGKSLETIDPTKLGQYILLELKSKLDQKAVAEPLSSKKNPEEPKAKFDGGGYSDSIHDGSGIKIKDLADKSKTTKTE